MFSVFRIDEDISVFAYKFVCYYVIYIVWDIQSVCNIFGISLPTSSEVILFNMPPNPDKIQPIQHLETRKDVPLLDKDRKIEILYTNVLVFTYFHVGGLIGLYACFTTAKWLTILLGFVTYMAGTLGIMAGAHRLWAHRSYKAKLPLELILIFLNSFAGQYSALHWARDHRLHHKFSDTEADPHNSRRGFFYSHVGWLMVRKSKHVAEQGSKISTADLYANKILVFQRKYSLPIIVIISFFLPTFIPVYFWGESLWNAWHVNMLRFVCGLTNTFLVNSVTHAFGYKPYDTNTPTTQNIAVTLAAMGEGYHNYHHAFPWDYRASELGNNILNPTTKFIDFFAWIGWAYDLKAATDGMVKARMARSGDGTDSWGRRLSQADMVK